MWTKASFAVLLLIAGCENGSFEDCVITCTTDTGCPDGYTCGSEGLCRAEGSRACSTTLLQHTADITIAPNASVTCRDATTRESRENSWYRAFSLADHGITGPLAIQSVGFAIQESVGAQQAQVKIASYSGAMGAPNLDVLQMTTLATTSVTVPETATATIINAPIDAMIPANGQFVVEIQVPDLIGTGDHMYIGVSTSPETRPGYLRAPTCNFASPRDATTAGPSFVNSHLIITVRGH